MRFKRAAKLLACVLSVSMCATPVFASSAWQDAANNGQGGSVDLDLGVNSPTLKVKVPTKFDLKVNPFHGTSDGKVENFALASKEFVISNNTSDNSSGTATGVGLMCTATARINEPKDDVMISYNTVAAQAGDTRKLIHMELAGANGSVLVSQNTYTGDKATITNVGSRLQTKVAAPNVTAGTPGYGAFAIVGEANTNADWQAQDLKVALSYRLRAVPTSENPVNLAGITLAATATSANNASAGTGNEILDDTVLTSSVMAMSEVFGIIIHSPTKAFPDYILRASEEGKLDVDVEDDGACTITIPKGDTGINAIANNSKLRGKAQDLLIVLTDGRVIAGTITVS